MKIGHTDIEFEAKELTREESDWLRNATGHVALRAIQTPEQWRVTVAALSHRAAALIGENQMDSGIGFGPLRSLLFKLHDYDIAKWERYLAINTHPPSGRLLALWIMPQSDIQAGLDGFARKEARSF